MSDEPGRPEAPKVRLSGIAVMGDKQLRVREAPAGQPTPSRPAGPCAPG